MYCWLQHHPWCCCLCSAVLQTVSFTLSCCSAKYNKQMSSSSSGLLPVLDVWNESLYINLIKIRLRPNGNCESAFNQFSKSQAAANSNKFRTRSELTGNCSAPGWKRTKPQNQFNVDSSCSNQTSSVLSEIRILPTDGGLTLNQTTKAQLNPVPVELLVNQSNTDWTLFNPHVQFRSKLTLLKLQELNLQTILVLLLDRRVRMFLRSSRLSDPCSVQRVCVGAFYSASRRLHTFVAQKLFLSRWCWVCSFGKMSKYKLFLSS